MSAETEHERPKTKIEEARDRITDAQYLTTLAAFVSEQIECTYNCDPIEVSKYAGAVWAAARIAGEKLGEAMNLLEEVERGPPA